MYTYISSFYQGTEQGPSHSIPTQQGPGSSSHLQTPQSDKTDGDNNDDLHKEISSSFYQATGTTDDPETDNDQKIRSSSSFHDHYTDMEHIQMLPG